MTGFENPTPLSKTLFEKSAFSLAVFCFTLGILLIYGYSAQKLGFEVFNVKLWEPLGYFGSLINLLVIILVILSRYYNYKYRNHFDRSEMENPEILYFICFPMCIFVIFSVVMTLVKFVFMQSFTGTANIFFYFTSGLYFIAILVFLVQNNGIYDYGEIWIVNFINMTTVVMIITTQIFYVTYNISKDHVHIYLRSLNKSDLLTTMETINSSTNNYFIHIVNKYEPFMIKSFIFFGLSCVFFLLNPFLKNYRYLQTLKKETIVEDISILEENRKYRIPLEAIFFSGGFAVLYVLGNAPWPNYADNLNTYIPSGIEAMGYVFLIVFSILQIEMMKDWPYQSNRNYLFNEIVIWIGLGGQMFHSIAVVAANVYIIIDTPTVLNGMFILKYILEFSQTTIQSITESMFLEKKWKKPVTNKFSLMIMTILFSAVFNMLLGASDVIVLYNNPSSPLNHSLALQIFATLSYRIGTGFCILQRIHGSILMFSYLRYVFQDNYYRELNDLAK